MTETGASALAFLDAELSELRARGIFRYPRVLDSPQQAVAVVDGRKVINLSSNNYLGLANHPYLKETAEKAVRDWGVGSGAVRPIIGTLRMHEELERRIAAFKKTEAALVFQSGFTANAGTVAAILGKEDVIVSDELNHASIIDGCRLSRAEIRIFPHRDVEALRRLLEEARPKARRILVVTDGVFSMDGDIAPLPEIVRVAREFGAITMVDDAHASGVLGKNGRGSVDHFGLHGQLDIQVGTLSKAIGVLGGYVAGSRSLIDYLIARARPFLFSTSHPPAVTAACLAAFDLLEREPERIQRLWDNTRYFKDGLKRIGFDTGASETPITPVIVGDEGKAMRLSDELFDLGVFAQGIVYPTVPRGKARVRTIVTAEHTRDDLDRALEAFEQAGRRIGVVS
ncbi:glycine C-acetyltransferase [Carboxydochorda subterranea]|uniref:8-amino-7-ketopelargonate synthase n=1 Tax=Carboxydichorda subterranea TaxID=3109565 RepID=A0ABZ1BY52_9FIRM|nr:glycine C-acetyltransferase [Limnochorda sp. L945t]WRP17674.1 glycine C-acetyltransferase [Limnochorda sp. L945t]